MKKLLFALLTIIFLTQLFGVGKVHALDAACQPFDIQPPPNGDGTVDARDTQAIAFHSGAREGDVLYDSRYDTNRDGLITSEEIGSALQSAYQCYSSSSSPPSASCPDPCPSDNLSPINEDPKKLHDLGNVVGFSSLGDVLGNASVIVFLIAGMIAILIIIWGGFRYMAAQGDEKAIASARNTIIGAVVGLIIVLSIGVIATIIESFLHINLFGS